MFSIYRKVVQTSVGLDVSDDEYALISEANIDRYEMIGTVSIEYRSVVVAVSKDKFFLPLEDKTYTLQEGIKVLGILNQLKIKSIEGQKNA